MSHDITSALAGPALGLTLYIHLRMTAHAIARIKPADQSRKCAERAGLNARLDIVLFSVIGFFVAPPAIG